MFDIYNFIEPKETADYCRSLGQTWNPFEMAVIIGGSSVSIAEKHTAWKQLLDDYPDMPTHKNFENPSYESFHKELIKYMNHQNRILAQLKKQEQGTSYRYRPILRGLIENYLIVKEHCFIKFNLLLIRGILCVCGMQVVHLMNIQQKHGDCLKF